MSKREYLIMNLYRLHKYLISLDEHTFGYRCDVTSCIKLLEKMKDKKFEKLEKE